MRRTAAAIWLASISFAAASPAVAQGQSRDPRTGSAFAGGSLIFWTLDETPPIPRATIGLNGVRVDSGPLATGRPGVMLQGGGFLARRVSLAAEFAWRASRSTTVEERSYGHSNTSELTWRYIDSDWLLSAMVGTPLSARPGRTEVQLHGGLTFWTLRQAVADRSGVEYYPGGQVPITGSGQTVQSTRTGVGGGADVLVRLSRHLAAATTIRLHFVGRGTSESRPPRGPGFAIVVGGGLRWERGR